MADPTSSLSEAPKLWILWSRRLGDLRQMQALAHALAWPCEERKISFRFAGVPALAQRYAQPSAEALLKGPWPQLILCSEATCAGLAQTLRRRSDGRIKVVAVGRTLGDPRQADLVLTTAQYGLTPGGHVVELALPLGEPVPRATTPGVHDLLLLGGSSAPDILDAPSARAAFEQVRYAARAKGRPLVIATSPRTSPRVVKALKQLVQPPDRLLVYGDPALDYRGIIASAADVTVTSDSISMLADALAAGKPVQVFPLPQRQTLALRLGARLKDMADGMGPLSSQARALFASGVIEPVADRTLLHARLRDKGLISMFGEGPGLAGPYRPEDDMARAVAAVRQLMRY